jgi:hypothetical protein
MTHEGVRLILGRQIRIGRLEFDGGEEGRRGSPEKMSPRRRSMAGDEDLAGGRG